VSKKEKAKKVTGKINSFHSGGGGAAVIRRTIIKSSARKRQRKGEF
jgi:hypothetical protein